MILNFEKKNKSKLENLGLLAYRRTKSFRDPQMDKRTEGASLTVPAYF